MFFMIRLSSALLLVAVLASCKSSTSPAGPENLKDSATFALIQSRIFDVSCTQCHTDSRAIASGNLSLDRGHSFASLVGAVPDNAVAADSGLLRVSPNHPEMSFLMRKLTGTLEPGMGVQMPNGGHPLSNGKIEFIRQWISYGAPLSGSVADPALLTDDGVDLQAALVPLPIPDPDSGFQIHMPAFEIPAGDEREVFRYIKNPNAETVYIKSMDVRMREGSHHFVLWNVNGDGQGLADGQLRDRSDVEMDRSRSFLQGSQTLEMHYDFPPGIAMELPAYQGFDLNSHYVNSTSHVMHGEAYVNLYTTPISKVQHIATPFLIADQSFQIPAHQTYTRQHRWQAASDTTHLIMLTSHAHRHMTDFKVWINSPVGKPLYETDDWHEPAIIALDTVLLPGDALYSETTWKNDGNTPLHFGFTSEDEMNILLGYTW
jgi:hypothetical protein